MSATIQPKGSKLYVVVDAIGPNGKRKQKWISTGIGINGSKRKAEEIRKEIEREYEIKNRLTPSNVTLDEFAQKWIRSVKGDIDVITYGGYESIVQVHIIPYFKEHSIRVNDITTEIMQAYFDEMKTRGNKSTGKGLSPKTLRSHMNVFRQIFFERKALTIKHTVVTYNGQVVAKDSTKTDSSNRVYPLSDEMISLFRWLKDREDEERKICGADYIENDYVFKWPNGKTFDPDYVSKHFKKLLEKNEFKHIRFHALRHSCAGLLLSEGYELYDVMEWLGHSDISITAKFYGHLNMKRKKALGNSISNSLDFGKLN